VEKLLWDEWAKKKFSLVIQLVRGRHFLLGWAVGGCCPWFFHRTKLDARRNILLNYLR
jgi:hypothetical protein